MWSVILRVLWTVTAFACLGQLVQLHMMGILGRKGLAFEWVGILGAIVLLLAAAMHTRGGETTPIVIVAAGLAMLWICFLPSALATIEQFWEQPYALSDLIVLFPFLTLCAASIGCAVSAAKLARDVGRNV